MNVEKLSQVNFTGAMLVSGTPEETNAVEKAICAESKKGLPKYTNRNNFDFEMIRQAHLSDTNVTDLFTTEGDALELQRYYRGQEMGHPIKKIEIKMPSFLKENRNIPPIKKNLGLALADTPIPKIDMPKLDTKKLMEGLDLKSLGKAVKGQHNPITNMPTHVYSAKEVLEAIKAGLFDFVKLVIKTTA